MSVSSGLPCGQIMRSVFVYVYVLVCAYIDLYAYFAILYQFKETYYGAQVCMSL